MNARDVAGLVLVQDPDSTRRYTLDWGSDDLPEQDRWLDSDETIAGFTVEVDGDAVVGETGADEKTVTFLLSGVTLDYAAGGHRCTVRIETNLGQSQDASWKYVAGEQ